MRIVHSLFTNGIGGTERHLAELVNAQIQQGHEPHVIIRGDRNPGVGPDPFLAWLAPEVSVIRVGRQFPYFAIRRHLKRLQPDIVHTHHRRDSRYFGIAARGIAPVVATLHMPYIAKPFKRHHGIICVSPWQLSDIPTALQTNATVVSNWVIPVAHQSDAERKTLRAGVGVNGGEKIIGAVGRLEHEKGMDILIDAFLAADLLGFHLCICGDGEKMPLLQRKIAALAPDRIHLNGYDADIHKWYGIFDLFVLPSRSETFGLVLLEAMDARCPIVTTRNLGAIDILGKDARVFWSEPDDIDGLTQALRAAAPHAGERWEYPSLELHSLNRAVRDVEKFYRKIIKRYLAR